MLTLLKLLRERDSSKTSSESSEKHREPWQKFLSEWAEGTGLVMSLYDAYGVRVAGPFTETPLGNVFAELLRHSNSPATAWENELVESVRKDQRPVEKEFESMIDVIAQPLLNDGQLLGVLTLGWSFSNFPDPLQCQRLANSLGLAYKPLFLAARAQPPVAKSRLHHYRRMIHSSLESLFLQSKLRVREGLVTNVFAGLADLLSDFNTCETHSALAETLAKHCRLVSGAQYINVTLIRSADGTEVTSEDGVWPRTGSLRHFFEPLVDSANKQVGSIEFLLSENAEGFIPDAVRTVMATQTTLALERLETRLRLQLERQELKRTTEELRSLNSRLEQFTSIASHDLQAPLRNMRIFAQLIKLEATHLSPKLKEYLDIIDQSGLRLSQLVTEFLKFAQSNRAFDLNETFSLSEAVALGMEDCEGNNPRPEVRVEELPIVRGNKILLSQVFKNLINNAIKYSDKAETKIKISGLRTETGYSVCVEDNGPGITSEHLRQIFEPFFRGNPGGKVEGFGLGLSLCRQVIERHGGEMWAESTASLGTRFYFTLPIGDNEDSEVEGLGGTSGRLATPQSFRKVPPDRPVFRPRDRDA